MEDKSIRNISHLGTTVMLCFGLLLARAAAQSPPSAQRPLPIPWLVPSFMHHPPDDSVVFGSLLEAAGTKIALESDLVGVAAGNFCGGSEKELVLAKNTASNYSILPKNFSILRGPTPYIVRSSDLSSNSFHPWRAVAAGNLDNAAFEEFVAIRKVTASGVPDLVVAKANSACKLSTVVASATIGNPSNSDWVGAAVGDFDGTGRKQIALLRTAHSNFFS